MTETSLIIERNGPVATLTLNRPKQFNALDADLRKRLRDAVVELDGDADLRVVVLRGEGRGFCAGADLAAGFEHPVSDHITREYKPILTGIAESRLIWVAQVHGSAAGIGAALAMNCDLLTMADDATVYMAFAAIALVPDGGNTQLLLSAMGYHRALQAVLEGERISADTCLQHGIANALHSAADLDAETAAWAEHLASGAPLAMAAAKRLLRNAGRMDYGAAIDAEGLEQDPLLQSADSMEGVAAFFAKRKPVFTGA